MALNKLRMFVNICSCPYNPVACLYVLHGEGLMLFGDFVPEYLLQTSWMNLDFRIEAKFDVITKKFFNTDLGL